MNDTFYNMLTGSCMLSLNQLEACLFPSIDVRVDLLTCSACWVDLQVFPPELFSPPVLPSAVRLTLRIWSFSFSQPHSGLWPWLWLQTPRASWGGGLGFCHDFGFWCCTVAGLLDHTTQASLQIQHASLSLGHPWPCRQFTAFPSLDHFWCTDHCRPFWRRSDAVSHHS